MLPGGEPSNTPAESVGSFGPGTKPYYGTSFAAAYASAMVARLIADERVYGSVRAHRILQTLKDKADTSSFASYDADKFGNGTMRV